VPACPRAHIDPRRPANPYLPIELLLDPQPAVFVDEIPLVERKNQCAAGFLHRRDDPQVLFRQRQGGIQQDDRHLGTLDGRGCTQTRVVLMAARLAHAAADAGCVDESPCLATELDELVHRVDGRAGLLVDDDPLFLGKAVEEAGLADVRLADQGDAARTAETRGTFSRRLGQHVEQSIEQLSDTASVGGGDGQRRTEPERPQRGRLALPARLRMRTTASSTSVAPTVTSTTNSTASAAATANSACVATLAMNPRASGSHPPVSTSVKRRPRQSAS
jgi:hypothetical protein